MLFTMKPEDILPTYEAVGAAFSKVRNQSLFEKPWLDRFLASLPGPRVLDLGCGGGLPLAAYLHNAGVLVTGCDGAVAMTEEFQRNLPDCPVIHQDMRQLHLDQQFDGILAWNSFFHLAPEDQRRMFPIFQKHMTPGGILMFTSGPDASERIGEVEGRPVYHASLSPRDYRKELKNNGFEEVAFNPEDPGCKGHTIWMARASVA